MAYELRTGLPGVLRDPALFNVDLSDSYAAPVPVDRLDHTWSVLPQRPDTDTGRTLLVATPDFSVVTERMFLLDSPNLFVQAREADSQMRSVHLCDTEELDPLNPPTNVDLALQLSLTTTGIRLAFGHDVGEVPIVGGLKALCWHPAAEIQELAYYDLIFRPKHGESSGTLA